MCRNSSTRFHCGFRWLSVVVAVVVAAVMSGPRFQLLCRCFCAARAQFGVLASGCAMVEKAPSDGEFYGQGCCYGNEIGNISSPGVEEGAESDEQEADSVMHFHCQNCGYEDDTGFIIPCVRGRIHGWRGGGGERGRASSRQNLFRGCRGSAVPDL